MQRPTSTPVRKQGSVVLAASGSGSHGVGAILSPSSTTPHRIIASPGNLVHMESARATLSATTITAPLRVVQIPARTSLTSSAQAHVLNASGSYAAATRPSSLLATSVVVKQSPSATPQHEMPQQSGQLLSRARPPDQSSMSMLQEHEEPPPFPEEGSAPPTGRIDEVVTACAATQSSPLAERGSPTAETPSLWPMVQEHSQTLVDLQNLVAQLCDEFARAQHLQAEHDMRLASSEEERRQMLEDLRREVDEKLVGAGNRDRDEPLRESTGGLDAQQADELRAELQQLRNDIGRTSSQPASPMNLQFQLSDLRSSVETLRAPQRSTDTAAVGTGASSEVGGQTRSGISAQQADVLEEMRFELIRLAGMFEELRPDEMRSEVNSLKDEISKLSQPVLPADTAAFAEDMLTLRSEVNESQMRLSSLQEVLQGELPDLHDRMAQTEAEAKRCSAVLAEVDAPTLRGCISELQTEIARILDVELAGLWAGQEALRQQVDLRSPKALGSEDLRVQLLELRDSHARVSSQQHAFEDAMRSQLDSLCQIVRTLQDRDGPGSAHHHGASRTALWRAGDAEAALGDVRDALHRQEARQPSPLAGSSSAAALGDADAWTLVKRLEEGLEAESHHRALSIADLHQRLGKEVAAVFKEVVLRTDEVRSKVESFAADQASASARSAEDDARLEKSAASCECLFAQLSKMEQAMQRERDEQATNQAELRGEVSRAIDAERGARLEQSADLTSAISRERSERCGECSELRAELSKLMAAWHRHAQVNALE
mmetsp:Transcript_14958/g.43148  ORF Transcript_14958/g.43148 Transcript_14958/m.43148 type:complete len:775 (-) Transcript_14958:13-2337(-)